MKEMSNTLPGHKCMKVVGGHVIRWFLSGFSVLGKTKMDSKYLSIPRIIKYNIVGVSNSRCILLCNILSIPISGRVFITLPNDR